MIRVSYARLTTQSCLQLLRNELQGSRSSSSSNRCSSSNSSNSNRCSRNAGILKNYRDLNTASAETAPVVSPTDKYLHYNDIEGYYRTSSYEAVHPLNIPLDKYVWRDLKQWQNTTAAVCIITGRQYSYAQLRDASAAFAVRLQTKFQFNNRNDVIAICMPNAPEYSIALLGAIEAGVTVTTVNPIYTAEEIGRQLAFSNAKFIVGTSGNYSAIREACQRISKDLPIACVRLTKDDAIPSGAIDFAELVCTQNVDFSELRESQDFNANDMVLLPFSSGTTGMPKGVKLSHNNITSNCEQVKIAVPIDSLSYQDTLPCVLPFFHIYGLTIVMLSKLAVGARLVTMPQFKAEYLIKSLDEYKGSILNIVPPIVLLMLNHPKLSQETAPALRQVMTGAAPIGLHDIDRFLKKFPKAAFQQGFGMTETSPVIVMTPTGNTRYASIGVLPGSTEAKIIDIESTDFKGLGPNVTGELCARGPQVMVGYLNNDAANKEIFLPRGWLRTGDVAYYDNDGYFYITDRLKELIKVKGFQVPPAELEAILRSHPKILEAAVFGIPHEVNGEAPRALVVLRPNITATDTEIYDYVAERVVHYKKLEGGILFANEIPKNSTGKILRKDLKAKYGKKSLGE